MAVEIFGIQPRSLAERAGMEKGDKLISMNGHEIVDVLDYRFFETNTHLTVVFEKPDGTRCEEKIIKSQYGALGLEFETYLMDKQRSCYNKCVFCFIDQLPSRLCGGIGILRTGAKAQRKQQKQTDSAFHRERLLMIW